MISKGYRLPKRTDGKKTFAKITSAAEQLFTHYGFHGTSTNEIIEKAGIATGTFYLYFDDKKALYLYLLNDYGKRIRNTIKEKIKDCKTRYEKEREGLKAFLIFAYENPIAYKIFWESLFVDMKVFKDYYETFGKDYERGLKKGRRHGEIKKDIDLETLSFVLMGISNFVGLQVLFNPNADEEFIEKLTDDAMKILKDGIFIK